MVPTDVRHQVVRVSRSVRARGRPERVARGPDGLVVSPGDTRGGRIVMVFDIRSNQTGSSFTGTPFGLVDVVVEMRVPLPVHGSKYRTRRTDVETPSPTKPSVLYVWSKGPSESRLVGRKTSTKSFGVGLPQPSQSD